jgi:phasin family protein
MAKKKSASRKTATSLKSVAIVAPVATVTPVESAAAAPAVGLKAAREAAKAAHKTTDTVLNTLEKSVKTAPAPQMKTTPKETIMTDTKQKFEKMTADAATLGQEQVEAIVQSSTLFFKGAEDFFKTYTALAQETAQKNAEGLQTLMGCKTLNELTETQNQLAKDSFEGFIAQATKLSELSLKVAKESLEPINAQVTKTMQRATAA